MAAFRAKDQEKIARLNQKSSYMNKMNMEMMQMNMRPMMITFVPPDFDLLLCTAPAVLIHCGDFPYTSQRDSRRLFPADMYGRAGSRP